MAAPARIERIYAWIVTERDGGEGVPAVTLGNLVYPLLGADRARIESFREDARHCRVRMGCTRVRLVCFDRLTEIEELADA